MLIRQLGSRTVREGPQNLLPSRCALIHRPHRSPAHSSHHERPGHERFSLCIPRSPSLPPRLCFLFHAPLSCEFDVIRAARAPAPSASRCATRLPYFCIPCRRPIAPSTRPSLPKPNLSAAARITHACNTLQAASTTSAGWAGDRQTWGSSWCQQPAGRGQAAAGSGGGSMQHFHAPHRKPSAQRPPLLLMP
jgi:hypothetical protein